jgi:hypothetical protein
MSDFEYIVVLLSIILGLGITQLLSGIARLVRDGRALAPAWWVMLIVATLLLAHFQVWWASFTWRDVQTWNFFSYVVFMLLPMLLYLLAYLILPADLRLDGRELAREFIERRRPFFAIMMLVPLASLLHQYLMTGALRIDADAAVRLSWLVLAVPGFVSRRTAVQATLAVVYFVEIAAYICALFVRLQ